MRERILIALRKREIEDIDTVALNAGEKFIICFIIDGEQAESKARRTTILVNIRKITNKLLKGPQCITCDNRLTESQSRQIRLSQTFVKLTVLTSVCVLFGLDGGRFLREIVLEFISKFIVSGGNICYSDGTKTVD